jgi:hypothetical protein
MEKPAFTRANLSDIRVIMTIMRVPVKELLCQAVTGQIPLLKCLWSSMRRSLWSHPIVLNIK